MKKSILDSYDLLVKMENTNSETIYRDKRRSGYAYLEIDSTGDFLEIAPDGKHSLVNDYRLVERKTCPECGCIMEALAYGDAYNSLYRCPCGHEEREGSLFPELLHPIDLTSGHVSFAHWIVLKFGGSANDLEKTIADIVKAGLIRSGITELSSPDMVREYVIVRHPSNKAMELLSEMENYYRRGYR